MFLTTVLKHSQLIPDQHALISSGQPISYRALLQAVEQLTDQLAELLPPTPVTVGLCLWNQPEWVITLLSLWQLGHTVVPLNPHQTPQELAPIVAHAQLSLLFTDDRSVNTPCPTARWINGQLQLPVQDVLARTAPLPADLALLIYTSGTTGQPKGVMLTHGNLWADVSANLQVIAATGQDKFISLSPFFHVFGLINVLMTSLATGAQLTLVRRFHPGRVMAALQQGQVTVLTGVPTMYQQLLRHWPGVIVPPRVCHSGAAPMPIPLFHQIERQFNAPVQEGYGLSEASSIVTSNPLTGLRKPGSIGVAIPGVSARVCGPNGSPVTVGTLGELWVSGPTVMSGYWQQPADRLTQLNDQIWLKTGDLMTQDVDGYLHFVGRADDQMNLGGLKCYPVEIETVLLAHPNILEAAVCLDAQGQLTAKLVTDKPVDAMAMRRYTLLHLTPYKVPRTFLQVDQLPKGPTGKLLRRQLTASG
jgi:long-chain acyl-CoA synthetase